MSKLNWMGAADDDFISAVSMSPSVEEIGGFIDEVNNADDLREMLRDAKISGNKIAKKMRISKRVMRDILNNKKPKSRLNLAEAYLFVLIILKIINGGQTKCLDKD